MYIISFDYTEFITHSPFGVSGLDSFSAFKLVTILRNLAQKQNKTIICSIHQPNAQVFELFHQVILLSRGKIVFMGNNKKDSLLFFKRFARIDIRSPFY